MSKVIFKHSLDQNQRKDIPLFVGAEILCVQMQNGVPMLWEMHDDLEFEQVVRTFEIVGTGWKIEDVERKYISTFQDEGYVFHVFERL
jgi:hypothetical protein